MKKSILLVFIVLANVLSTKGQITDVVTGLDNPQRLLLNGNDLYYTTSNSVFKIDITQSSPTPEQVVAGLLGPEGMALNGNMLFIAEFGAGRISSIDITDTNPTRVDFITGLNTPNFLLLDGNFLYYSDNNSNIVERIDITAMPLMRELVATSTVNFSPLGLAIKGSILYMAQGLSNRISSVNVTDSNTQPTDVVVGVNRPLGLAIDGSSLYIVERNDNKISVKDLDVGGNLSTDAITGLSTPNDMVINSTTIFIIENGANKISKIDRSLGVDETNLQIIFIYPNPTSDYIEISNITEITPFNIYNILGQQILKGIISANERINVSGLSSGAYMLQLANKKPIKFIKK